jgi:exosortase
VSRATQQSISRLTSPVFAFILGAISLAIWWGPLASTLTLASRDDRYTHILLIIPVSAALLFLDWKDSKPLHRDLPDFSDRSGVGIGSMFLGAAVLITVWNRWKSAALSSDLELTLNMLSFVLWSIAAFVLCFGTRAFRRSSFPLCFLFWLVPLPEFALNVIVRLLQQGSVLAAHFLFWLTRVPATHDGMFVHIPGLTLEVAPECSSIRSSLVLVVTTMVLAQLLLRSPWRRALLVAVAIPLSVAKNGLRIYTIAMLGTRVDPGFLTGRLHSQGGFIFFAIALAGIFLLLWILRRAEKNPRVTPHLTS